MHPHQSSFACLAAARWLLLTATVSTASVAAGSDYDAFDLVEIEKGRIPDEVKRNRKPGERWSELEKS